MKKIALAIIISYSLIFVTGCAKEDKYCWTCFVFAVPESYVKEYCDKTEEEIKVIREQFNDGGLPTKAVMYECKKK